MTLAVAAFMLVTAAAFACTPGRMNGELWLTGPAAHVTDEGVGEDVASRGEIGSCPADKDDAETAFATGDVVCVQARHLPTFTTESWTRPPDGPARDAYMETDGLYELRYAPVSGVDDVDMTSCHNSRKTLPNLSSEHGLYEARSGAHGTTTGTGWEDQQTVLDMPTGDYSVCAASVNTPAADAVVTGTGQFDAGDDGDPGTGHLVIAITGPEDGGS